MADDLRDPAGATTDWSRQPDRVAERDAQRRRAIASANRRRDQQARLRKAVKDGAVDPLLLLAGAYPQLEPGIGHWRIEPFLRLIRRMGPRRAFEVLAILKIAPNTRLDALDQAQRETIAETARLVLGQGTK